MSKRGRYGMVWVAALLLLGVWFAGDGTGMAVAGSAIPQPPLAPPQRVGTFGAAFATNDPSWGGVVAERSGAAGALVIAVVPHSPAEGSGLIPGDVVVAVDDHVVADAEEVGVLLRAPDVRTVAYVDSGGSAHQANARLAKGVEPVERYVVDVGSVRGTLGDEYLATLAEPDAMVRVNRFERILSAAPGFALGYAAEAESLFHGYEERFGSVLPKEKVAEVQALLSEAVRLGPSSVDVHLTAARVLLGLVDPVDARSEANLVLAEDQGSGEGQYVLGVVDAETGHPREALDALSLAVRMDPYRLAAYAELAKSYASLGLKAQAKATREVAKVVQKGTGSDLAGGKARPILLVTGVAVVGAAVIAAVSSKSVERRGSVWARLSQWLQEPGRLSELVGAICLFEAGIPIVGGSLGFIRPTSVRLAVGDYWVPALVAIVGAALIGGVFDGTRASKGSLGQVGFALIFFGGVVMIATHMREVSAAASGSASLVHAFLAAVGGPVLMLIGSVGAWRGGAGYVSS